MLLLTDTFRPYIWLERARHFKRRGLTAAALESVGPWMELTLDVDLLPELLAKFVDVSHRVQSELSTENPKMRSLPTIDFSKVLLSDDAAVGLPLFAVALLRISESNDTITSAFSHWRRFCPTDSRFKSLIGWIELAERQLTLDPATSLRVIYSTANFWSERVPAAINLARLKNASPKQVLIGQIATVQFLFPVPWIYDVASAVANMFANYWQNQLGFRAQFSLPRLTIPDLERACHRPDKDGLAKISDIINASSRALNQGLDSSVRGFVDGLASH